MSMTKSVAVLQELLMVHTGTKVRRNVAPVALRLLTAPL
jgi:hypothetical protein